MHADRYVHDEANVYQHSTFYSYTIYSLRKTNSVRVYKINNWIDTNKSSGTLRHHNILITQKGPIDFYAT